MMTEKKILKRQLALLSSPVALIRLGAVLCLILTIGHLSGYPWTSAQNPREKELVASMKSSDFIFAGEHTSYWNLYFGWGLYVAVLLLMCTLVTWLLSGLARLAPRVVGIMIQIISVSCVAEAYLSFRFFYIPPFILSSATFVLLQITAVRLMKN